MKKKCPAKCPSEKKRRISNPKERKEGKKEKINGNK
jgi:hypothetical protein